MAKGTDDTTYCNSTSSFKKSYLKCFVILICTKLQFIIDKFTLAVPKETENSFLRFRYVHFFEYFFCVKLSHFT